MLGFKIYSNPGFFTYDRFDIVIDVRACIVAAQSNCAVELLAGISQYDLLAGRNFRAEASCNRKITHVCT